LFVFDFGVMVIFEKDITTLVVQGKHSPYSCRFTLTSGGSVDLIECQIHIFFHSLFRWNGKESNSYPSRGC